MELSANAFAPESPGLRIGLTSTHSGTASKQKACFIKSRGKATPQIIHELPVHTQLGPSHGQPQATQRKKLRLLSGRAKVGKTTRESRIWGVRGNSTKEPGVFEPPSDHISHEMHSMCLQQMTGVVKGGRGGRKRKDEENISIQTCTKAPTMASVALSPLAHCLTPASFL